MFQQGDLIKETLFQHALYRFLAASCSEVEFEMPHFCSLSGIWCPHLCCRTIASASLSVEAAADTGLLLGQPELRRLVFCSVLLLLPLVSCWLELSATFHITIGFCVFWAFKMLALMDPIGNSDYRMEQLRWQFCILLTFHSSISADHLREILGNLIITKAHETDGFETQGRIKSRQVRNNMQLCRRKQ